MNIAHIESKPVPAGQRSVTTLLRRCAACCLIGEEAMSAAVAGPRERDRERERDGQTQREPVRNERAQRQYERPQRQNEPRRDERQPRQSDPRADEPRRSVPDQQNAQNNADAFRRSGRLTPDERRDLRRQINEAGADIYQTRRRR